MNVRTRIKLFFKLFNTPLTPAAYDELVAMFEATNSDVYAFDGFTIATAARKDLNTPIRAVVNKMIAVTEQGIKMVDDPVAKEVMKIIVEWNKQQKEKHASRYKEGRRNNPDRRDDQGEDSDS